MSFIKSILSRIENLSEKFLQPDDLQELRKSCDEIRSKYNGNKLFLAVVGEFSSGKSTFINALIGQRLLKEAVFPTTACATYIEHNGSELAVTVVFNDGKKYTAKGGMIDEVNLYLQKTYQREAGDIFQLIEFLTSDVVIARDVKALKIDVPNAKFPQNIVLIDTPGFNPGALEENNHFEITSNVVGNQADMAIVLTSAQQAMSASLQHFLLQHVRRCIHRCIFVVSKIDLISAEERCDVLDFTRQEITGRLGVSTPHVYGVSSVTMLPVKMIPDVISDQWNALRSDFEAFESSVWRMLEQKREIVISEHVLALINTLMDSCKNKILEIDTKLAQDEKMLRETRVEPIRKVADLMVTNAIQNFTAAAVQVQKKIIGSLEKSKAMAVDRARGVVSDYFTECKSVYSPNFEKDAAYRVNAAVNYVSTVWVQDNVAICNDELRKAATEEIATMAQTFNSHYDRFPALKGLIDRFPVDVSSVTCSEVYITGLEVANEELNAHENKYSLGGAAGGATVGLVFGGPVGAAVGAAVGWVIGLVKGDKSLEKYGNFQTQSAQAISDYFDRRQKEVVAIFDSVCLKMQNAFSDYGKRHVSTYGERVATLINAQEALVITLKNMRSELRDAFDILSKWQMETEEELIFLKHK